MIGHNGGSTSLSGQALILVVLMSLLAPAGCLLKPKRHTAPSGSRQQPKTVDARAQQRSYDIGLQHYSKEEYTAAREAFVRVIDLGPSTPLAGKAQENIRKIDRILKTLEEIESK